VLVECLDEEKRNCEVFPACVTWHVWKETQDMLVAYFESVTVADLCALARAHRLSGELDEKFVYEI